MDEILKTNGLSASYDQIQVLRDVSISVYRGGVTALLGANGSGKTTTLRAICNMMVKTAGEIHFDGQRIDGLITENIVRSGIAHVPDGRGTFVDLTVEENLRVGAYTRRDRVEVARDFERIYGYFPRLRERRLQQAGTLSGGEQQMLAISRALIRKPKLMLLDEPSFGLAPLIVKEIFKIISFINREESVSVLLVEQNAKIALEACDHAFLLENGKIVAGGSAAEMRENEAIRRAYLGD